MRLGPIGAAFTVGAAFSVGAAVGFVVGWPLKPRPLLWLVAGVGGGLSAALIALWGIVGAVGLDTFGRWASGLIRPSAADSHDPDYDDQPPAP
jgi:hypothetical protein